MNQRISKPIQHKNGSEGGYDSQGGANEDLFALMRDTQSPYRTNQIASIQALQPRLGNQAVMRFMASQGGSDLLSRRSTSLPVNRVQRQDAVQEREEEETQDETEDMAPDITPTVAGTGDELKGPIPNPEIPGLSDIPDQAANQDTSGLQTENTQTASATEDASDLQTETDTNTDTETSANTAAAVKDGTEVNDDSVMSNSQVMQSTPQFVKGKSKKLGAVERLKQFKPGKIGPEIKKAAEDAVSAIYDFVKEVSSSHIKGAIETAAEVIGKALFHTEFVQDAIRILEPTLRPIYDTLSHLIQPLIDALGIVNDILPIVGGVIQLVQGVIGTISNLIKTIMSINATKLLHKAKQSASETVKDVGTYGFRKVLRRTLQRVYETGRSIGLVLRSVTNIGLDIAAAATMGMSEAGKAVTAGLGAADALIHLGERSTRSVKGIVKALKGTRGVGRKEHATKLVDAALEGDEAAQQLIIDLGVYKITARVARTMKEGKMVLKENAMQGAKNVATDVLDGKFGLKKSESEDIAIAFQDWGHDKLDKFYKWLQSKYAMLKQKGLIATVIDLLKGLLMQNKDESKQMLKEDIESYKKIKNTVWKKALVMELALKFKSS